MSGIKQPILDVINKLKTIAWPNNSGQTPALYSEVWNSHFKYLEKGDIYPFALPAAFVEVQTPEQFNQLGYGIVESDVIFRIHVMVEQLDAGDGTNDQNLSVFALRDKINQTLTHFQPTACSLLMKVAERQDFDHDNLYVYELDFKCSFIDDTGSTYPTNINTQQLILEDTTGFAPVEILSIAYSGGVLTIVWKLVDNAQNVLFTIGPSSGNYTEVNQQPGTNISTHTVLLSSGSYTITAKGIVNEFITPLFKFTV